MNNQIKAVVSRGLIEKVAEALHAVWMKPVIEAMVTGSGIVNQDTVFDDMAQAAIECMQGLTMGEAEPKGIALQVGDVPPLVDETHPSPANQQPVELSGRQVITAELGDAVTDMYRALRCLRFEIAESIVDDLSLRFRKVEKAAFAMAPIERESVTHPDTQQPDECRHAFIEWHKREFGWLPDAGTHPQSEEYYRGFAGCWDALKRESCADTIAVLKQAAEALNATVQSDSYAHLDGRIRKRLTDSLTAINEELKRLGAI